MSPLHMPTVFASLPCSLDCVHQKATAHACLHPSTMCQSGGWLVLLLSCMTLLRGVSPSRGSSPCQPQLGAGGEVVTKTQRVTCQWDLENPSIFDPYGGLWCCCHPQEVAGTSFEAAHPSSVCQLPSLLWLPTTVYWVGGGVGAMMRLSVRWAVHGGDG